MLILWPQKRTSRIYSRFVFILFVSIILFGSCQKNNEFSISGKISHAEGDTICLEELQVSTRKHVAKVKIDKNGEFEFKGKTSIPTYYLLMLSDNNFITLLVDSVDNLFVEADAANFGKEYVVQGSLGSIQVKELTEHLNRTEHKLDSLRQLSNLNLSNPDFEKLNEKWNREYAAIIEEQTKFSTGFVLSNPFSMASVFALYQRYRDQNYVIRDLQTMRTAASALNAIYPNSNLVKALYENTLQYLREQKAAEMKQFIEQEGLNSPDIVLPDLNGKETALSSLRGKVVLLHFWAAEDPGSRILNPLLVDAYQKYKSRGLEIYQVNVGTNRSEWIDAIDEDKLKWINVGDLEGSTQARLSYNIQNIPFNYLLDKEGKIVAKNLTGTDLDKALAQILR
ncbi:MAG: TlpA disulfide reductase family protein [Draconibacterium sp.]|nr:TlpA disulfide reductase family protein [Draconibacterium sp.]